MYLYPLWVRLWHFINAVLILILIITGFSMLFAGSEKTAGWHNLSAIILIIDYVVFIIGNVMSGNGKYYMIKKNDISPGIGRQLKYFFNGRDKNKKHPFPVTPENKFNPLQKVTYLLIMYLAVPLIIITGIILLIPDMFFTENVGQGMYILVDILHIIFGLIITLFLIIHIYSCTIGAKSLSLFRGIISGYYTGDE
jgi:thiosulfate reductase cytochrome b subunit